MTNATLTADAFPAASRIRSITDPRLDRVIAGGASLPFAYMLYYRLAYEGFDLPRIAIAINFALLIGTMVVRRPPVRVTPKPLYWVTAFVATYWGFMTLGLAERGEPIAPMVVTHGLALASLVVSLAARVSLGRNIGFVPAQRELVTSYAYGIVRHPIYTGVFLSLTAFVLRAWSPTNFVIAAVPVALFAIKSFMEERFLGEDPAYRRYMDRVRFRWFPGIA
jgi:protein-S-isoprenylcysteine O-methyltransferase Ste14